MNELTTADYEAVLSHQKQLVRELDVLLNGVDGAATQASLCDIVGQLKGLSRRHGGVSILSLFSGGGDAQMDPNPKYSPTLTTPPEVQAEGRGAWMPIETAPKDSKSRLVWCPERKNQYLVYWNKDEENWWHFGSSGRLNEEPTHWQPLPKPPAEQGL